MALPARYADGRVAVMREVTAEIAADAIRITTASETLVWPYTDLRRADDDNGRIILRKHPDTGERLQLERDEAAAPLKQAAPELFKAKAFGVEGREVVGSLVAAAASLAAVFLLGVPLMAQPIASVLPNRYRNQISDISWSQVERLTQYCDDSDEASTVLNGLAQRLMTAGHVQQKNDVWVTIVRAGFPNAFTLPDDSIIVTDQLIAMADDPDELAGVLAHEIGHIQHRHVMANVIRNVGAGIFFDVVFGGSGAGQAVAVASVNLASLRYSRGDETEADQSGLDYMEAAHVNPGALARLFERVAETERGSHGSTIPTLLASHPASAARAALARARAHPGLPPSLTAEEWRTVRTACGGSPAPAPTTPPSPAPQQPPPEQPQPPVAIPAKPDKQ